jgi:hypothetical protein
MDMDPTDTVDDTCEGCNLYDKKRNKCYEFVDIIEECPCRICIIKMICRTHCIDALRICYTNQGENGA